MNAKLIQELESRGCRVVAGSRYCVVDKGERGNRRDVSGLDDDGAPMEITGVCILSVAAPCKIYHGNSIQQVQARMRAKNADIAQGSIDDTDDVETAFADGRVNRGGKNEVVADNRIDR